MVSDGGGKLGFRCFSSSQKYCFAVVEEPVDCFMAHIQGIDGNNTDLCPDGIVDIFWSRIAPYVMKGELEMAVCSSKHAFWFEEVVGMFCNRAFSGIMDH